MTTKSEQKFTVGRTYRGYETFTVLALSAEEALQRLEDEGPETSHVSERDLDEYESVESHIVFDVAGSIVLERREPDETGTYPTLRMGFRCERRGPSLYFQATHKAAAAWHGPYGDLHEFADTIAHYVAEDIAETLLKGEIDR